MRTQVEDAGAIVADHHGRDDGSRRDPGALSGAARQRARHSHRLGRVCGTDQRFRRGGRPRASRARADHAEEARERYCPRTAITAIRSTSPPASRRTRCRGGQGAARRSQYRHAVHLVSDQRRGRTVRELQQGHGRTRPSPRSWSRSATPGRSAPTSWKRCSESPAVFSRSSDRMLRAIALYTRYGRLLARSRASIEARADSSACPSSARARNPNGWARKSSRPPAFGCPMASLPARRTKRSRRLSASAIRSCLKAQAAALVAQDRSGRRHAQSGRSKALRAAWATMLENVKRAAPRRRARRHPRRKDVAEGRRTDDRGQARSRLGHGAAGRAWAASGSRRSAT